MIWRKAIIYFFVCCSTLRVFSQGSEHPDSWKKDTVKVNRLLDSSKASLNTDPNKAIAIAVQAKELSEKIDYAKGKALGLKFIGLGYYYQGKYLETLGYWNESLQIFENLKDDNGVANLLNNIAAVYSDQGDETQALEYSLRSLKISEKTGDKLRILSALNTVGGIYYNKKATWDKALGYLIRALPLCEEIGNTEAFGVISENIGEIYFEKGDDSTALRYFDRSIKVLGNTANSPYAYNGVGKLYLREGNYAKALEYHNIALSISEKLNGQLHALRSLDGLGNVYMAMKDYPSALAYYNKAALIGEELKVPQDLKDLYQKMANTYAVNGDYKTAFKYRTLYADIKDTLYNIETDKKLGTLQFDFDLQKKQGEINLLTKDKSLKDSQLKRQKFAKNAFMIGLALVGLIALLIFRNYRNKAKTHRLVNKQKNEIENLLLNILPEEVAQELQQKGSASPRHYESVSVMFTDFKAFTLIADKMEPQDLLEELNACFIAFDNIIEKHNLEKIKTIGDSYMCAGGIPTPDPDHVINIVKASLDIRDYVVTYNKHREENGLEPWHIRIGIHVGPIVAGVVGKKKYAYDIWGSTVNIASRMESNGEPQQVNVSSAVYELIKDKYACTYRGKISAKNVGDIDMYFVEGALVRSTIPAAEREKAIHEAFSTGTSQNISAGSAPH